MRRFIACILLLCSLTPGPRLSTERIPAASNAQSAGTADLKLASPSALLMERETGTVLYEKNAHERLFPASVTKVMTLLLIAEDVDSGKLKLSDTVTASERAASFGGSCVYLEVGEQMSVSDMIKCIAVVSANDCAVAMAEHLSGTEEAFVARMNQRAEELGLTDTHFTSCSGLFDDGDHYSSAQDIALMSRELLQHAWIRDYTTIWLDSIRNGAFELNNTNKLVYWYPGCTGLKTGYTSTALYCLSASAERDGVEYIAVVLRCESIDKRNQDAKTLLNYAFASYQLCPLRPADPLPELPVDMGQSPAVPLQIEGERAALVPKSGAAPDYELILPKSVCAPLRAGDKLGTLRVTLGGETVAELPVTAAESVPRLGFFGIWRKVLGGMVGL
ncbi:MAG: D-alanyl-D-alanine carboxypeptidase [Oscillospiraceae bacterium]|nr:D-alanyl-D-alanine carboxypeptidase [Oscillospiraceae bacterium]